MNWEFIEQVSEPLYRLASQWQKGDVRFWAVRYTIPALVIPCLLLALSGCALRSSSMSIRGTQPLVKIGLAAPFEGLDRPLGYEALAGVKLALAERNAAGGVAGYMVELVALNDFGEPDEARLQAREFAADPAVIGVITGWSDETARVALPVYRQVGLAVAVAWSVPPELADRESGVVLVAADTQRVAEVLAEVVVAGDPDRIVVVGDELSATPYAASIDASGSRVQVISPPDTWSPESIDEWSARLTLSRIRPPDALILTVDGTLAGELLLSLSTFGWMGESFGGAEAGSVNLMSVAEHAAAGLTFASPAPAGKDVPPSVERDSALGQDLVAPRAVLAYDATHVLLDAIELSIQQDGHPSRQGVMNALPEVRRDGLTGVIAFDTTGRRIDAPVWLYNIVHKDYPGEVSSCGS